MAKTTLGPPSDVIFLTFAPELVVDGGSVETKAKNENVNLGC